MGGGHDHGHGGHSHSHGGCHDHGHGTKTTPLLGDANASGSEKKLRKAIIFAVIFMLCELFGGLIANSVAIMTDAAHMLSDVGGLFVSLMAVTVTSRLATHEYTYGYHQAEVVGAALSIALVWLLTGGLLAEAFERMKHLEPIDGRLMFYLATLGLLVNITLLNVLGDDGHAHSHDGGHGHSHAGISFTSIKSFMLGTGKVAEKGSPKHAHSHGENKNDGGHSHSHGDEGGHSHSHGGSHAGGHSHSHGDEGGHSHSHGGSYDGGHSHSHGEEGGHSHSHGENKNDGGHSHSHGDEGGHSHSHGGSYDGGHSHSHGEEGGHSHSHGGSYDGGHSHSHGDKGGHSHSHSDSDSSHGGHNHSHSSSSSHDGGHSHSHCDKKKSLNDSHSQGVHSDSHGISTSHSHGATGGGGHGHTHSQSSSDVDGAAASSSSGGHEHSHNDGGHSHSHGVEKNDGGHSHSHGAEKGGHSHSDGGHGHSHGESDEEVEEDENEDENLAMRAAIIHVMGDIVQSIGVMFAAFLIWVEPFDIGYTDEGVSHWNYADPLCTFLFAILVLLTTKGTALGILNSVMMRTPDRINIYKLKKDLESVPNVSCVHDIHVWSVGTLPLMTCHAVVPPSDNGEALVKMTEMINNKYRIDHTTIQVEVNGIFDHSTEKYGGIHGRGDTWNACCHGRGASYEPPSIPDDV